MTLTPSLRLIVLTAHVVVSFGWLGAVAGFLALAVAGLIGHDAPLVHAAYLGMEVIYVFVIVPLGLTSLLTGLVLSLGTQWGLVRYYWVLVKLLITIPAVVLMLMHIQPVSYLGREALEETLFGTALGDLRIGITVAATAALIVLIVATILSVYKPRGMTRYGWRKYEQRAVAPPARMP